jgi:hypothetical protein
MAQHITGFETNEGVKQYDYNALANRPAGVTDATNTVISPNADYAEVGEWADGNPTGEDRLGYFVAIAAVGDNTIKIRKATSADDVRGVSVYNPAFSGNASKDKYGEDGDLLPRYNYIGVMGIVKVIDNGLCSVNGRCMPGDDGTAIPSDNNMGYGVLERVDEDHVLIAVEPGADMIQRVRKDVGVIENQLGVSVERYGAVGDGSADDTAAFKAALAAERVLFVPGGTYKLTSGITISENCTLELAQDAVLNFTNTTGNCITLLRLANLKGNHATINVPYSFTGNVVNCDTGDDEAHLDPNNLKGSNATAVPPFTKWSPQWKMSRYMTDINICKPKSDGEHNSVDGACSGTAVYVHCNADDFVSFMWGVSMSGVRIAGAFNYGIRAYNIGAHVESWNHDMRIEAVIDGCKVGVSLENCYYARLEVSVQARAAANGAVYATHGIELRDSRGVDMSGSRVWDWNGSNSLWASGNQYQHLALYGECRGLILDDFMYYENSTDIRDLIYTNKASNLEQLTILQEPLTRWFKPKDGEPVFFDGLTEHKLMTEEQLNAHFGTALVKNFTDVLATATDENGAVLDGKGYTGGYLTGTGALYTGGDSKAYYVTTGFIPCAKGQTAYVEGMSYASYDGSCTLCMYDANKKFISTVSAANLVKGNYWFVTYQETAKGFSVMPAAVVGNENVAYIRFTVLKSQMGEHPMIAVDEEIKYTVEGVLADGIKVKGENIVGLNPGGSFDDSGLVKSVNGNTPDENGNVEIDLPDSGGHFVEGAGELVFSHTATFATNSDATFGVPVPDVSVAATLNAVYWLEVNGEMLKCHWEQDSSSSGMILNTRILYDEGRNEWVRSMSGNVMVYAQTAGTYTYSLYAPSNDPMLDPRYIPANVAKKSDIPTGGGSASIDVTAEVGQTIIVKEVDASGKPTKWESADYQPRTHWSEETVILPDTVVEVDHDAGVGLIPVDFTVEGGEKYTVKYNGVEYVVTAFEVEGQFFLGNVGSLGEGFEGLPGTNDPFALMYGDMGDGTLVWVIVPLDGSATVTVAITETVIHALPTEYAPKLCIVDIDASAGTSSGNIHIAEFDTTEIVNAILNDRPIYANFTTAYSGGTDYSNERLPVVVQGDYLNGESLSAKEILKLYLDSGACSANNAAMTLQVWSLVNSKRYTVYINQASD